MKITRDKSITHDLDYYLGKACIMTYILNSEFEIEIHMPINWNLETFKEALKDSYLELPETIHIKSMKFDNKLLN